MIKYILSYRFNRRALILLYSFFAAFFGILSPYFQKTFIDILVYKNNVMSEGSQVSGDSYNGLQSSLQSSLQSGFHGNFSGYFPNFFQFSHPLYYMLVAAILLIIGQAFNQLSQYVGMKEALIMQRLISQKIYDQMMTLKLDTMTKKSIGEIVALYATDVPGATIFLEQTLPFGATTFFPLILTPIILVNFFNTPVTLTILLMLFITIVNTYLAFNQSKYFYLFKKLASDRLGLANEWIQNIRTLRILGWTETFEKKIIEKRIIETNNRVNMVTNGQVMNSISTCFTFIINVSTLGFLTFYYHQKLTPGEIFALLWILGVFLTRPFRQMPWFFTFAFDAISSIRRIEDFLSLKNKIHFQEPEIVVTDNSKGETILALEVKDLQLNIQGKKIIEIPHLEVYKDELLIIVGEVGSGKSMLLYSLLNETNCTWKEYKIFTSQSKSQSQKTRQVNNWKDLVTYVPQEGFIVSTTLRDNILLEYESSRERDDRIFLAIEKTEMSKDVQSFPLGLDSEFGERGVNLSGGQRQRINISRAEIASKEIIFLDDCFSAIDVETERKLLENLILKHWQQKTIVMTSHRLSLLPHADRIIFLKDGLIKNVGKFEELLNSDKEFREFTLQITESTHTDITPDITSGITSVITPEITSDMNSERKSDLESGDSQ